MRCKAYASETSGTVTVSLDFSRPKYISVLQQARLQHLSKFPPRAHDVAFVRRKTIVSSNPFCFCVEHTLHDLANRPWSREDTLPEVLTKSIKGAQ